MNKLSYRLQIPENLNGRIDATSFPCIAVDTNNDNVCVSYAKDRSDNTNLYLVRSIDKGQSWNSPVKSNDYSITTDQWMPSVAVTSTAFAGEFCKWPMNFGI